MRAKCGETVRWPPRSIFYLGSHPVPALKSVDSFLVPLQMLSKKYEIVLHFSRPAYRQTGEKVRSNEGCARV